MTRNIEEQLREALAHRAESTVASAGFDEPERTHHSRPRSIGPIAAVAAAAVLVVGGMLALDATSSDPIRPADQTPAAPQSDQADTSDTAAPSSDINTLSLDEWIGLPDVDAPEPIWTIIDTDALPNGVELTDESGSVLLGPPIGSEVDTDAADAVTHQYVARLRSETGTDFVVVVTSMAFGPCSALDETLDSTDTPAEEPTPDDTSVDIGGVEAAIQDTLVCWTPAPGVIASVEAPESSLPADAAGAIDLARQIEFTDVARLPQSTNPEDEAGPDIGDLGGTLNGAPWLATVDPSSLRTMTVYADGRHLGGFINDRLSQPTDAPATTGELSLNGVPGRGSLLYGYLTPDAVSVRVVDSNGTTKELPMLQRDLESFFAVPIPEGVTVETLEFIQTDGTVYATAEIGPLPIDFDGTYGGFTTIVRSPSTPD